jgi:hypothetical protein
MGRLLTLGISILNTLAGVSRAARALSGALLPVILLLGCAGTATEADTQAASFGFQRLVVSGTPYKHLLYFKPTSLNRGRLHVYIEHDGVPWFKGNKVTSDPTPSHMMMFELMQLDSTSVLYLGRPCYFRVDTSPPCDPLIWTHKRYSEEVLKSMEAALKNFLGTQKYQELVFFGYSGGGTLAVLLTERFPQTRAVVTIASNLDVDGWAKANKFSPLEGSIDPMMRPALNPAIVQWHYAGGKDKSVPAALVKGYTFGRPGTAYQEIPNFDHVCCWERLWPNMLAELSRNIGPR